MGLRLVQIGAAGIAAIGHRLAWRFSVKGDVTLQHRKQPLAVGRVHVSQIVAAGSSFSPAGTGSPASTRRWLCTIIRSMSG